MWMQPVLSVEQARRSPSVSRALENKPAFSLVFEGNASEPSAAGESFDLLPAAAEFVEAEQFAVLWVPAPNSAAVPKGPSIRTAVNLADAVRPNGLPSPMWVAVGAETEQFKQAAQIGAYVFTQLLGRSVDAVAKDVELYRRTWTQAGHKGQGFVTLVVPTLAGEGEAVRRAALQAMQSRLRRQPSLLREAVWDFAPFLDESDANGITVDTYLATRTSEQLDPLIRFAAERYVSTAALVGPFSHCRAIVEQLKEIGVDEIGCLIDFGWPTDLAREQLTTLNDLRLAIVDCQFKDSCLDAKPPIDGHAGEISNSRIAETSHPRSSGDETTQKLSELWAGLLDVSDIHPDDNFFDLGGHSLLAARAASEIERTFGVRLPIKSLMVSSLGQLAAEIERLSSAQPDVQTGENVAQNASPASETAKRGRLASWFKNSRKTDRFQDGSQPC
jgi:acyl carrier protein